MHVSQSSGDAGCYASSGATRIVSTPPSAGPVAGTWRFVTGLIEDLTILGQFAFGRDYRAGEIPNARLVFTSRLVSGGSV